MKKSKIGAKVESAIQYEPLKKATRATRLQQLKTAKTVRASNARKAKVAAIRKKLGGAATISGIGPVGKKRKKN